MMQTIEANWIVLGAALIVVLLVGWLLLRRGSKAPARREYKPDVLDEGAASVHRNQALIDAPPAAQIITPAAMAGTLAGVAEAVAVGAQDVVEEAEARVAAPPPPPPSPPSPPPPPAPAPVEVPVPEPEVVPVPEPEPVPGPAPAEVPEPEPEFEPAPQPVPEPEPEPQPVEVPDPEPEPVPQPEPEPEPEPEPIEVPPPAPEPDAPAAAPGGADDLSRIKGLGPKLQTLLPALGITSFAQIAALSEADLSALDAQLGPFAGRPAKDSWVEQAQFLASGDVAGFEEKFGKV